MNPDIRVRSNTTGRTLVVIAAVAALALVLSFGLSFLPAVVSAAPVPVVPINTHYIECHNQVDDNGVGGIDLKDSGCNDVDNDIPELFNQDLTTTVDTATSTTLVVIDADNDLLYFEVTEAPQHGTLSVIPTTAFTLTSLPTITYTPNAGYVGTDSFNLKVNDGRAGEDDPIGQIATFSVTVIAAVVVTPTCAQNEHLVGNTCVADTSVISTVVVRLADLAADFAAVVTTPSKWFFYNDENDTIDNTLGSFVLGPSVAPIGSGSAEINVNGTQRRNIATYQFKSIKLSQITALSFSTYSHSSTTAVVANRAPYLNFNVSFDGVDSWQRRLAFVPNLNGSVTTDTWQTWNAANPAGLWVYSGANWPAPNAATPGSTPLTLTKILADYPNIQTRASDSWFGFRVGEPYADGFTGNVDNFVITVDDGANATTTTFDFEATDPSCTPGQHLDNHVCVADPAPTNTGNGGGNGGNNNGGGVVASGPLSIGFVNTNPTGGQVLGASTELPAGCSAYLTSYLKKGMTGEQVKKLQNFLNSHLGLSIPVTGTFGPITFNAVAALQTKYADEILKPWFDKGLAKDMNPSGYAYKTTLHKINLLQCATLNAPAPQLP